MKCPNCGKENIENAKFCVGCGKSLIPVENVEVLSQEASPNKIENVPRKESQTSSVSLNYIMYFIGFLYQPFKVYEEEKEKLKDSKNGIIVTAIAAIIIMITHLLTTILTVLFVSDYSFEKGGYVTTLELENLKNIPYFSVIGKGLLMGIGLIFILTITFYIGTLIMKKEKNFFEILVISASASFPFAIISLLLSNLLSLIYLPLGTIFLLVGFLYFFLIYYELINENIELDKNKKLYLNTLCFLIAFVICYYAYTKIIL